MAELTIPVEGMTCGGCVGSIERALRSLDGVTQVAATLSPGQVTVTYEPARLESGDLVQAITDAGYDVPSNWNGAR
jgi:copper chaperone